LLDEVSKDEQTYSQLWGRVAARLCAEQHNPFVHGRKLSMVAGLALGEGIIAAQVVGGSFTREIFMEYLRDDVVSYSHICMVQQAYTVSSYL
jgi:hypothetical protein